MTIEEMIQCVEATFECHEQSRCVSSEEVARVYAESDEIVAALRELETLRGS